MKTSCYCSLSPSLRSGLGIAGYFSRIRNSGNAVKPARFRITPEKNRECALVVALAFLLGFLLFGSRVTLMLALYAAIVGILIPALMEPVSCAWCWLLESLGWILFRAVSTVAFFCGITPTGFFIRMFGRKRKEVPDPGQNSFFLLNRPVLFRFSLFLHPRRQ